MITKNEGSYITDSEKDLTKIRDAISKDMGISKEKVANNIKNIKDNTEQVVDELLETLSKVGKKIDPSLFVSIISSSIMTFTWTVVETLVHSFKDKEEQKEVREGIMVLLENIKLRVSEL